MICFNLWTCLDLSRNCAAPLTAYYAQKENYYGNETHSSIQTGSSQDCTDEWANTKASNCRLWYRFFDSGQVDTAGSEEP